MGIFLLWVVCAGFSAFVAKQKNRDSVGWFFLGLLFGPIALLALAAIPPLDPPRS